MDKQKEAIIKKLKENGCRITKQRLEILDIILEDQCSSCKEIYYRASETNSRIGIATVYRMVSALEEIGVVSRRRAFVLRRHGEIVEDGPEKEGMMKLRRFLNKTCYN